MLILVMCNIQYSEDNCEAEKNNIFCLSHRDWSLALWIRWLDEHCLSIPLQIYINNGIGLECNTIKNACFIKTLNVYQQISWTEVQH